MGFNYDPFKGLEALYNKCLTRDNNGPVEFNKRLSASIARLQSDYRSGRQPELSGRLDHLAYMIQYAPIGMVAVRSQFERLRNRPLPSQLSLFNDDPLRVVSIGAGPGTDLFGVFMSLAVPPHGLNFHGVDMDREWAPYFTSFCNDFSHQVQEMRGVIGGMNSSFSEMDLTKASLRVSVAASPLGDADIVILNRVLSGFQSRPEFVHQLIREITRLCHSGALLVVVDVNLRKTQFLDAVALTEGVCRLEKPSSKSIAKFKALKEDFSWNIPSSIKKLESQTLKIMRSGEFFGGVVWLQQ